MDIFQTVLSYAKTLAPTAAALVAVIVVLAATQRILERHRIRAGQPRVMSQLVMLVLSFAGLLVILMVLPVSDNTRGQLYTLLGVLVSASIALSSTTIIGNAMAGVLIRFMAGSRVRPGDYIRVEDHVGRVTEMGILHTMIQTETRDVTWLPNLWMVGRPATLRQRSGTIVNAVVSLGYNVERMKARAALLHAAEQAGLGKPFVRIEDLGNFAVTYKVGGLLADVSRLRETHSILRGAVLDSLHGAGIEVASPVIETSRVVPPDQVLVPQADSAVADHEPSTEDEIMFDQAVAAAASFEEIESMRAEYQALLQRRDATKNVGERRRLTAEVDRLAKKLAHLED